MKWIEIANQFWEWIVGAFALTFIRTKLGRFALKKLADYLAKPIYDWTVRKGYIKIKTEQAERKQEDLENAKTKTDIDRSIDQLP